MLVGLNKYYSLLSDKILEIGSSIILYGKNGIGKFSLIYEVLSGTGTLFWVVPKGT